MIFKNHNLLQLLRYAFRYKQKTLTIVSVLISKWPGMRETNSQHGFWRVDLDQVSPFSSNRNGIITSSSISCKFSLIVFGDDVNTLIVLSSPFFDLERERSKISRASPVSCRMEIDLIFTKSI